jgi:hypothetical protein
MEFIKKHYEKIILSVVLLCLLAAAVWLPQTIKSAQQSINVAAGTEPSQRAWKPADFSAQSNALIQLKQPTPVVLAGGTPPEYHNLFNPVTWKLTSSNTYVKVYVEGPDALVVKDVRPLYLTVTYDRASAGGYFFSFQRQSGKKYPVYLHVNDTAKVQGQPVFTLLGIKGAKEDPEQFTTKMLDTQETVTFDKQTPYSRVDGYVVDLSYPPEPNLTLKNKKVGDTIMLSGEAYNVVAINKDAVIVRAVSTTKPTTIPFKGSTPP